MDKRVKIGIAIAVGVVILIIAIVVLQNIFATRLVITTSKTMESITITSTGGNESFTETNTDRLSQTVNPGEYTIEISGANDTELRAVVAVEARETTEKHYDPPEPSSYHKLLQSPASNLRKASSGLTFINAFTKDIERVSDTGFPVATPISEQAVRDFTWLSDTKGLVLMNSGFLYLFDNGQLRNITPDMTLYNELHQPLPSISFSSGENNNGVVAINNIIYTISDQDTNLNRVATVGFTPDTVAMRGEIIIASQTVQPVHGEPTIENEEEIEEELKGTNAIINLADGSAKKITDEGESILFVSLSPDGSRFFFTSSEGYSEVRDTRDNAPIQKTAQTDGITALWRNNDQLIVAHDDGAWEYNLRDEYYYKLAAIPHMVTSLTEIDDLIYITTFPNSADAAIYTLGESEVASKLEEALPTVQSNFSISYSLLGNRPSLNIETFASLNDPNRRSIYEEFTRQYRQEALDFLTQSGLNVSDYRIIYTPDNI